MRLIYKYTLTRAAWDVPHTIPESARFLDLQVQDDEPVMWWSVSDGPSRHIQRLFRVMPTGGPAAFADDWHYVGTFQVGGFVGHVITDYPVLRA